jgi:hypothetical protein
VHQEAFGFFHNAILIKVENIYDSELSRAKDHSGLLTAMPIHDGSYIITLITGGQIIRGSEAEMKTVKMISTGMTLKSGGHSDTYR